MKKIVSLVLAIMLVASLAVMASAVENVVVPHGQEPCAWVTDGATWELQNYHEFLCGNRWLPWAAEWAKWAVIQSAEQVQILEKPEDLERTVTTCAQAITAAELKAICEANEDIKNLTVFQQRNVSTAEGGEMTIRLWPCNPASDKYENQSVVVLYRAEPAEGCEEPAEWIVLGNEFDQRECTVTLPAGEGAYVVCLGW